MILLQTLRSDINRYSEGRLKTLLRAEYWAVLSTRLISSLYNNRIFKIIGYLLYQISKIIFNIDIHPKAKIGNGFVIAHLGGIVIGGHTIMGDNCTVNSCITLGEARPGQGMPIIGSNCYISTGAKVLGAITIHDNSIVGANAVVVTSFDKPGTIVGIPAKLISK